MDPYNAFAAWSLDYVLLRNGRHSEASEIIGELKVNHPDSIISQLGHAILTREITHSLALAGQTDEALDWLENTVRIGNINFPFWAQHKEWVVPFVVVAASMRYCATLSENGCR